MTNEKVHSCR